MQGNVRIPGRFRVNRWEKTMKLEILKDEFCICQVPDYSRVRLEDDFCFTGRTDRELSLVCRAECLPENALKVDPGWRALRVAGVLDFSLVGILSDISGALARAAVPLFALSTYDTDYILVRREHLDRALAALAADGFQILAN